MATDASTGVRHNSNARQVWAVMMVKDEADILGFTLRHLLASGVDGIVIADNNSRDETREIIYQVRDDFPQQIFNLFDAEIAYYQSRKMTHLAQIAHEQGATWIVPCDADELWYSWSDKQFVKELRACESDVVGVPLWNHFATSKDAATPNPFARMGWRQSGRNALDKIAYRFHSDWTIAQGNHFVLDANGQPIAGIGLPIGIRHFPYRTFEQFKRKVQNGYAAYRATNLPDDFGAHWRAYGETLETQGENALREIWDRWFYFSEPENAGMVQDPAPLLTEVLA